MSSTVSYAVSPYRPSGRVTAGGVAFVLATSLVAGILVGLCGGPVSDHFYLVFVFPVIGGAAAGVLVAAAIRIGRVQNPKVASVCAALGALLIMPSLHLYGYRRLESTLDGIGEARLAEVLRAGPDELRAAGVDPELEGAVRVTNLAGYLDWQARRGVLISRYGGEGGIRLGYAGSYGYWGLEIVLAAIAAALLAARAAAAPACSRCRSWMTDRLRADVQVSATTALLAVSTGDIERLGLKDERKIDPGQTLRITVCCCPRCAAASYATVRLERVLLGRDGTPRAAPKLLAQTSYPGAAVAALETMFAKDRTGSLSLHAAR